MAKLLRLGVFLVIITFLAIPAWAGNILDGILARGIVRCGVGEGIPGFSEQNEKGQWKGFNIDFCRALAAAVFGDADKVAFVPLTPSMQFPALQLGNVDVLVRNTHWTLRREAILRVRFPAVLYFDTQVILVREGEISSANHLNMARICIQKGTNHKLNLESYFAASKLEFRPVVVNSFEDMIAEFVAGRCDACTGDASKFSTLKKQAPSGMPNFQILTVPVAIQPLCPVVWGGDAEWATTIRLVLYALTVAEDLGITATNMDSEMPEAQLKSWTLIKERQQQVAESLGIYKEWAIYAIKTAGNYGAMYDRNLGNMSPFHIERVLNRLWRDGGLMYAPPFE